MWLYDLEKAIATMHKYYPYYIIEKVTPAPHGISFFTTHHSRVFWSNDGKLIERYEDGITIIYN